MGTFSPVRDFREVARFVECCFGSAASIFYC